MGKQGNKEKSKQAQRSEKSRRKSKESYHPEKQFYDSTKGITESNRKPGRDQTGGRLGREPEFELGQADLMKTCDQGADRISCEDFRLVLERTGGERGVPEALRPAGRGSGTGSGETGQARKWSKQCQDTRTRRPAGSRDGRCRHR